MYFTFSPTVRLYSFGKSSSTKIIDLHKKNLGCSFNEITISRGENVCVRGSINNPDEILK